MYWGNLASSSPCHHLYLGVFSPSLPCLVPFLLDNTPFAGRDGVFVLSLYTIACQKSRVPFCLRSTISALLSLPTITDLGQSAKRLPGVKSICRLAHSLLPAPATYHSIRLPLSGPTFYPFRLSFICFSLLLFFSLGRRHPAPYLDCCVVHNNHT